MKPMQLKEDSSQDRSSTSKMGKASPWLLVLGLLAFSCWELYQRGAFNPTASAVVQHLEDGLAIEAVEGTQRRAILPDGTKVWLNSGTVLFYRADMDKGMREVELGKGEVFFDVSREKDRPFRVDVAGIVIEQLGTQFNVQSYSEEKMCKTVVESGSVKVTCHDNQLVLNENDEADVSLGAPGSPSISVNHGVNANLIAGWVSGFVVFDNADLNSVLNELGRAYNVSIRAVGDIPITKFSGSFPRNESLEDLINQLDFHGYKTTVTRKGAHALEINIRR